jgi:glyoxylase I family protein
VRQDGATTDIRSAHPEEPMPALIGVHHVALTVTDVDRSAPWYERVLGFTAIGRVDEGEDTMRKVFLRGDGVGLVLTLVQHPLAERAEFDEGRPGLDHLTFEVDADSLAEWTARLAEFGVTFSPVTEELTAPGTQVIALRDPDGIQLVLWAGPKRDEA